MFKSNWKANQRYYLIPVNVCQMVLAEKNFRMFQIYMVFKGMCTGKMRIISHVIKEVSISLGVSPKTVRRYLKMLLRENWIGYNSASGIYFIRGFEYLQSKTGKKVRGAYWFYSKHISDLELVKAFLMGAFISELIHQQKWEAYILRRKKGTPKHRIRLPKYYPISNQSLSKILKVSLSTASKYKTLAHKNGFVHRRRDNRRIFLDPSYIPSYKAFAPDDEGRRIIIKNEKVYAQFPDRIKSEMRRKRRSCKRDKKRYILKGIGSTTPQIR